MIKKSLITFLHIVFLPVIVCANSNESDYFFTSKNKVYVISHIVDLGGEIVTIPDNCVIKFSKNGIIRNGCLIGRNTLIKANNKHARLFENVTIGGSWKVNKIYSDWIDFRDGEDNTRQIKSLFALCSSEVINDVYISPGTYWLANTNADSKSPALILIPSNTNVYNEATLMALPGNHEQSFLFNFWGVSNCSWDGGKIIGDLRTHIVDDGQQGYGLAIRGAKNVTIRNVECNECWGDGINLQYGGVKGHNENIVIDNVKCDSNRRQGISIEDGINVLVKNSIFSNTGRDRGHSPMKGIDIEPWYDQAIIQNVRIEDCELRDNAGGGLGCSFIKPSDSSITIKNIEDINGGLRFNSCNISMDNPGITVMNYRCEKGKLRFNRNVGNLLVKDSFFMSAHKEASKRDTLSNISFVNVHFKTGEPRTLNFYCLSLICAKTENILFDKCSFEVLEGSDLSSLLASGGDWSGVQIKNSSLVEHRMAWFYIPCDIINCSIETDGALSFISCKENGYLLFINNKVKINSDISGSPFLFHSSTNQKYMIEDNMFDCVDSFDPKNLISNHKSNKVMPAVSEKNNTFTFNKAGQ